MNMPFVVLTNVCKSYGAGPQARRVLQDINLTMQQGEFLAIVGYSGAGKTTLISLLAGLLRPDSGMIRVNGQEVLEPGPDRGVVFQNYSLLPWLSVYENVALAVDQLFPQWSADERRGYIEEHIAMVNLTAARSKRPNELSGGMRQRVSLARTLAMNPALLLMDEPLGALDALTRATLQDEIGRIWQQHRKTVVLITNDVDEGLLLADRIIPLSAGPAATLGPEVSIDWPRPRSRRALHHDPRIKRMRNEVLDYLLGAGSRKQRLAQLNAVPAERPSVEVRA